MKEKNIVHIATVQNRNTSRVFYRSCVALSNKGYRVTLIVADGLGNETKEGVQIIDLGKENNRFKKIISNFRAILKLIDNIKPSAVHFHSPELLFVVKVIQKKGVPVIYDIHENVPAQILDKENIPKALKKPLHYAYRIVERMFINSFHLVLAENSYLSLYKDKGKSVTTILNFPELSFFTPYKQEKRDNNGIFYIGGVSNNRGLDTIVEGLKLLKQQKLSFHMHFVGKIDDQLKKTLNLDTVKDNITFYGPLDLDKGYEISKHCKVGLAVLKPIKNYTGSYPTKIFEYMTVKLPVITSNFKLYRAVVEQNECGLCIDPLNPVALANAIKMIFSNSELANNMGDNGSKATAEQYNSKNELTKLLTLYKTVI